jgi:DNA-binding XRE family transcriptional regulator
MSAPLPNYLLTHRRRVGLSQAETAALLGFTREEVVSRYERWARKPSLETALAYEAIFRVPAKELFAGLYQKVEKTTRARARLLAEKLADGRPERATLRKLAVLESLCAGQDRRQHARG